MTLVAWLILLGTWTIAVVAPGPDFVAVLRSGASRGARDALIVSAGVVSGIACWITLALTGLGILIATRPGIYAIVRVLGAAFLIGYGLVIVWQSRGAHQAAVTATPAARSGLAAWRLGLMTNLANPKALAFFTALFASMLPAQRSLATSVEVGVVMLTVPTLWFALVSVAAGSQRVSRAYKRATTVIERVLGGTFVVLGGALLAR